MISMKIRLFQALMKKHVCLTIFIRVSSTKMAGERKYQFAQFCALGRAKTDPNVLKMVFEKYILQSVLSALIEINQGIVCEKCVKRSTCAKSTRKGWHVEDSRAIRALGKGSQPWGQHAGMIISFPAGPSSPLLLPPSPPMLILVRNGTLSPCFIHIKITLIRPKAHILDGMVTHSRNFWRATCAVCSQSANLLSFGH